MDLTGQAREAFGWGSDAALSAGPRGALGQIWRVETGGATYALKEIFRNPPPEAVLDAELEFSAVAAAAGVRLPLSHPDRAGRHLHRTPDGTWLRLYDWIDLRAVDLTAPRTPADLGTLLARLHRCAPPAASPVTPPVVLPVVPSVAVPSVAVPSVAPAGERRYDHVPPAVPAGDPWYDEVPSAEQWPEAAGPYTARLAERRAALPELCAEVSPANPADLIVCHRDLHPENVLAGPGGALTVVDWDNLGPAAPQRELARVLFDWYCDGPTADLDAMRALYAAYLEEGGPGRITDPADFTMLLACRLNFLLVQLGAALDPATEPRHREWAGREIDEGLQILPTRRQLTDVLAALR